MVGKSQLGQWYHIAKDKGLLSNNTDKPFMTIVSTLLYGAKTFLMTTENMRRLQATHHKQQKITDISWKESYKQHSQITEKVGKVVELNIIRIRHFKRQMHLHQAEINL